MKNQISLLIFLGLIFAISSDLGEAETRRSHLPSGNYTGAEQIMIVGTDGKPHYGDNLGICHIDIKPDGSVKADFPVDGNEEKGIKFKLVELQFSTSEPRDTWTATLKENSYKVIAIPYSAEVYVFRLEIWRGGKLTGGAQQFYGFCASKKP